MPPSIWSRQDIDFYTGSIKTLVQLGQFHIVLSRRHPLRQLGATTKRTIDTDKAIFCATMKDAGASYKEINDKFGWKPQKDCYYKGKVRYPTTYRYVALGRRLLAEMRPKNS